MQLGLKQYHFQPPQVPVPNWYRLKCKRLVLFRAPNDSQSALDLASRDASIAKTVPAFPSDTSATSVLKPSRSVVEVPDFPRSPSSTEILAIGPPRFRASSCNAYCRSVLSRCLSPPSGFGIETRRTGWAGKSWSEVRWSRAVRSEAVSRVARLARRLSRVLFQ
ncbi:hypothetical protein CA13_35510 [Planctomycetes bacterium CA13]|uniref:Uncharacterized protein n=1 Tax=Novipirellula herctigrandis TaxID=2527986 RepID=A0A5C5Z5J2_9BACT|nr:hypothetical protein CA13_35510 [Planctomycetes bacterium CA13]